MTTDLRTLATQVSADHPGLPVVLVGHSMGGMVATRYVQRFGAGSVAALVLSGAVIGGNPGLTGLLDLDPMPDVPIDPAILSRDPEVGRAYADDPLVYHGPLSRKTLEAVATIVQAIADGGDLGDLPTLVVHGEQDQLAPLPVTREAIERIRGTNLVEKVYPGAQHEVFNETNSDEVLADVVRFIDGVLADGS
jgi:alpha-beta hydrolase superfamily lysophospholipase